MLKWVASVASGLIFFTLAAGCTRPISESNTLKLTFPSQARDKVSGLAVSGKLSFAVINVQLPGKPLSVEYEFHENPLASGQVLTLEVPNVPQGSFLVQFLGVYEDDSTGQRNFTYGDATAVVANVTSEVTISPAQINTSNKEGSLSGRYINSNVAPKGPTGTLLMTYQPPDAKPRMIIKRSMIVDGWFEAMVLEGISFDYVLAETGVPLFRQIRLEGTVIKYVDSASTLVTLSTGPKMAQISMPQIFSLRNGKSQGRPASEAYVGYIFDGVSPTVEQVCRASDVIEGVPGAFTTSAAVTPVELNFSALTGGQIGVTGGNGYAASQLYTGSASGCMAFDENQLTIYHTLLKTSDGGDGYPLKPPFAVQRPFASEDNYLVSEYSEPLSVPTIGVKWKYLPGVVSVDGGVLFARNSSGGGGGGDEFCEDLKKDGFSEAGIISGAGQGYPFTGLPSDPLTANNKHNWEFAVCAYKNISATERRFVGHYVRGGRLSSGDSQTVHKGWAKAGSTTLAADTIVGANEARRVNGAVSSNALYTTLIVNDETGFLAGDEVLLQFIGKPQTIPEKDCGLYQGSQVQQGAVGFARVLRTAAGQIDISKGTFADIIDRTAGVTTRYVNAMSSGDYCLAQVVKVRHYRNLTIASAVKFEAQPFDYVGGFGGVLAFRVNGLFKTSTSSSLGAGAKGFAGGTMISAPHGAGFGGGNDVATNGSGGQGMTTSDAGGGGGGGVIGSGGSNPGGGPLFASGGGSSSFGMGYSALAAFGGGGAIGRYSSSVLGNGGNGGGFVFVTAHSFEGTGALNIFANGGDTSPAPMSAVSGGGGGGGSIFFLAQKTTTALGANLQFDASGGAGGTYDAANAHGGGGGGGGFVNAVICDRGQKDASNTPIAIPAANVAANVLGGLGWDLGVSGNGNGSLGQSNISDAFSPIDAFSGKPRYSWACGYND